MKKIANVILGFIIWFVPAYIFYYQIHAEEVASVWMFIIGWASALVVIRYLDN